MANTIDWQAVLQIQGWIDAENKIVAPGDAILKIALPEGRSHTLRGGKLGPSIVLSGEFLVVTEKNVDTAGRSRITAVALSSVESIETLA